MRFTPATGYPVVCAVARTPVGAHLGVLSRFSAPKLSTLRGRAYFLLYLLNFDLGVYYWLGAFRCALCRALFASVSS